MRLSNRGKWLKACLVASTAMASVAVASGAVAHAQNSAGQHRISYDIPAQPLSRSLAAFARASNIKIAYSAALTQGKSAPAIQGPYTRKGALEKLLSGSGLSYSFTGNDSVTISAASPVDAAAVDAGGTTLLDAITVTARGGVQSDAELEAATYAGVGTSAYVSQENIQRFRGSSAGDMLSGIPGVTNGENRNSGALDVNIRGMQGQGRSPVVIDGAMQEQSVYRGYAGMAGRTYLDPDFIGGVSVEKGPSSGPDAAGAIGGVVRARTLNPNDIIASGGTWGVVVRGGLANNNKTPPAAATIGGDEPAVRDYDRPGLFNFNGKNGSVVAAYRTETFDVLAGYARRKNGNYYSGSHGLSPDDWKGGANRFGYDEQIINTSMDNTSYLFRTVLRPNENHTLDLSYMRYESLFGEMKPSQLMYGDDPYQTTSEVEVDTYTARYRYDPSSPLVDVRADLWATKVDSFVVDPVRFDFGGGDIYNSDMFAATLSERWGVTLYNTSRFSGNAGDLAVSYGLAQDREKFGKSDDWDELNEKYPGSAWDNTREGWRRQKSFFTNAEYKPAPWVTFTAGMRYIDNVVQDTKAGVSWVQGGLINRDEAKGWAPSFSALVEPVKGLQFYARYAEALRAASPFEGTEGFTGSVNPYSDLKPEHAHNSEVGANFNKYGILTSNDLLQAKVSFFHNDVTDYITLGSERLTAPSGNYTDILVRTNIPRVTMQGVEVSAGYDMGKAYFKLGGIEYTSIRSCYSATPGAPERCYDGMPATSNSWFVNHIPPKRAVYATVGTRLFDERLTLGARYSHVWRDPDYELVDLFGSYRISDSSTVSFTVDNLFDEYYVDALSLGEGVAVLPAPGRTIRINWVSRFGDGTVDQPDSALDRERIAAGFDGSAPLLQDFNGDWSGFYAGAHWGGVHYSAEGDTTSGDGSASAVAASERTDRKANSILGGLQAGYNHQFGNGLVLGFEVDGSFSRGKTRQHFTASELDADRWGDDLVRQADYKQSYGASATGRFRLGQALGRTLLYTTAGLGLVQEKQTRTQYRANTVSGSYPYGYVTYPYFSETEEKIRAGVVVGAGSEYAFSNRLSLRTEYLYGYYPEKKFSFDRASRNIDRSSGSTTGGVDTPIGREAGNTLQTHSLRMGLNYRF